MANEDVNELLELADAWKRGVRSGGRSTGKLIDQLASALREAREDAKRLDFIEDCGVPGLAWESRMSTTGRGYRLHQHALGNGVHATARDAIDDAMKPPTKERTDGE